MTKEVLSCSTAYTYETKRGVGIFHLPLFSRRELVHGFSSRFGGKSIGLLAELNLSFTRGEEPFETTMDNFRALSAAGGFPFDSMVSDAYEHGTTVRRVDGRDCGRGFYREPLPHCDGLVTNDPAVTLITGHADCMAFYLFDPVTRSIGLAHAGWRGALGRIGRELVLTLTREYGAEPRNMIAGVGPSICPRCFEVGQDVAELFRQEFAGLDLIGRNAIGKDTVDLWQVAAAQFAEAGVPTGSIQIMGVCTVDDSRLYSYRRDKGRSGGMAAYLKLAADTGESIE